MYAVVKYTLWFFCNCLRLSYCHRHHVVGLCVELETLSVCSGTSTCIVAITTN